MTPRSRADSPTLIVVDWSGMSVMLIWLSCWLDTGSNENRGHVAWILCFRWIQFQPTRRHPVINGLALDACSCTRYSLRFVFFWHPSIFRYFRFRLHWRQIPDVSARYFCRQLQNFKLKQYRHLTVHSNRREIASVLSTSHTVVQRTSATIVWVKSNSVMCG